MDKSVKCVTVLALERLQESMTQRCFYVLSLMQRCEEPTDRPRLAGEAAAYSACAELLANVIKRSKKC